MPKNTYSREGEGRTEKEHRVTTPEEAAEMTGQRRRDYGLGEKRELTLEEVNEIDAVIGRLLERFGDYDFNSFSPEIQKEWDWVEDEALVGKDRELAKAVVEKFLNILEAEKQKKTQ